MRLIIIFFCLFSASIGAKDKFGMCDRPEFNRSAARVNPTDDLLAIEAAVSRILMETQSLPGAAIAVIANNQLVMSTGWGYADLESCQPVTPDTVFYLKSVTKSFLGLAAASLEVQGKINLSAPISNYLPTLTLPTPLQADYVSLQQHLTHTQPYYDSGLAYRTAYVGNLPDSEYVGHINTFAKAMPTAFRYSNFGPIVAAHAISQSLGENWRALIRKNVFQPLNMNSSYVSVNKVPSARLTTAYIGGETNTFTPVPIKSEYQMHAAGGSFSTLADLSTWVTTNLTKGKVAGNQVIPERVFDKAHAPLVSVDWTFLDTHRYAHGLGFYRARYRDDTLVYHFGGETHTSFMPAQGLGVIVLSNEIGFGVATTHDIALTVYDVLRKRDGISDVIDERILAIKNRLTKRTEKSAANVYNHPESDRVSQDWRGTYTSERLGDIIITQDNGKYFARFGELYSAMRHKGKDVFSVQLELWSHKVYTFSFGEDAEGKRVLDWGGRTFVRKN